MFQLFCPFYSIISLFLTVDSLLNCVDNYNRVKCRRYKRALAQEGYLTTLIFSQNFDIIINVLLDLTLRSFMFHIFSSEIELMHLLKGF